MPVVTTREYSTILKLLGDHSSQCGVCCAPHVHASRFPYPSPDRIFGTLYLLLLLLSGFPTVSKLLWLTNT
jgi:hypothetical protein